MSRSKLVVLRGGVSIPAPAYLLYLDLEVRGIDIRKADNNMLSVGPADRLTDADRIALRTYKPYLLTLVNYSASGDIDTCLFTDHAQEAAHA